jgi:hypothetical protein
MKKLIAAFILALPTAALAELPPCWPKEAYNGATGSSYRQGEDDFGGWLSWTCPVNGAPQLQYIVWKHGYRPIHPDAKGATFLASLRTYYLANISNHDPALAPLRKKARQEFAQQG